ncbi:PhoH family protein [Candidatus Saccharibacteria bacterium]|nr:PhoH family protein [Candidatus Saccharibacteria bacterium]
MSERRKVFVIDTNVLVDYPEIIPDEAGEARVFKNPTVDLANAHMVLPSTAIRELSGFKKEHTDRGRAARTVLKYARMYAEKQLTCLRNVYSLDAAIALPDGRLLSFLPVHADFKGGLPFRPAEDDNDGQIILTALAAAHLEMHREREHSPFGGMERGIDWKDSSTRLDYTSDNVTLLTNDNGLAIRARERGILTSRYSYDLPEPYTGRRKIIVPAEVFREFWNEHKLDREIWELYLPDEKPLVANEFIVFAPDTNDGAPQEYLSHEDRFFRHIGRYDRDEDAIVELKHISEAPCRIMSDGQAMYMESLLNPKIAAVICTGPAGSGKTYLPTVYGIKACEAGKFINMVIVPCADHGTLGALPGGLNEKMVLDVGPVRNAIRNYLLNDDSYFKREFLKFRASGAPLREDALSLDAENLSFGDRIQMRISLLWQMYFRNIPVEKAKGLDFSYELVLYDEFQDQSPSDADMLIKRIGKGGKIIITGDIRQIHAPYRDEHNNGIVYATYLLYDTPTVARVSLLKNEVERHELVRLIAERQSKPHDMQGCPIGVLSCDD